MATKKITYTEAMTEIEDIMARLRSGEMSIDELTSSVARATKLITECRKMLATTEQEVEKLINE
ncbi:MAG: exodeoxyribonuclease VII small subunit [Alistipes sp.]|nr:exodeoxyribonuclease VII small subunit [Alistipes sp.]